MGTNLKANADGSMGMEGVDKTAGELIFVNIPYTTASPLTLSSAVFSRACVVQSITAVPDVASTNAVTATAFKAASGTALGSGTALHSGTYNLQGTAATNQSLTLSATTGVTSVPAGSRVGIVISGALGASGSGVVTIALTPA
jgi:hypothetical protein